MRKLYGIVTQYPKLILIITVAMIVFLAMQLSSLRWETDARVYMPKGHPAIKYDERVEHLFGVKDAVVIVIENNHKSIYNAETLARVARITEKVGALPGVVALRTIDVASLATATVFVGTDEAMGAQRLMPYAPKTETEMAALKQSVQQHADLLVGNLVSTDGNATMIRAKLKEGAVNRYQTYWQIKGILAAENGGEGEWQGNWQQGGNWSSAGGWKAAGDKAADAAAKPVFVTAKDNGDVFYLAGRPVIEVTSGLHAMDDMKRMIPLLLVLMAFALFLVFRTGPGVAIPMLVMAGAVISTLGLMAFLNVPLYTISTMLPVILVAVGIGDSVHLLSEYYNKVLDNPHRKAGEIVAEVLGELGSPLVMTSATTAIGFLTFLFADMPPFKMFGLFTVVGIVFSWLLTVTFAAALLSVMPPKVSGYLSKRRSMRVHAEQDVLTRWLVTLGRGLMSNPRRSLLLIGVVTLVVGAGASRLQVNSSWMSDFKKGSEVSQSTQLLNQRFDGTIFLNVVIETDRRDAFKDPVLLAKMEALQNYAESLPDVGDTLSVVDFLKSMNKSLHAEDNSFNVLPKSGAEIAEALYLFSVSGQPELLDEVVDFGYQRANISISIKTDETARLKAIIDKLRAFIDANLAGPGVDVNFAGSANNSYIWADLLIDSQGSSIIFSKVGIFVLAAFLFGSLYYGVMTIVPVTITTILVAGAAGWLRVPLDVSTALAAGVAIGVGVDYAVHYLFRYRRERQSVDHQDAALNTLRSIGRTIVFNAVVVTVGFAVLFMSEFPPHVKLGVFVVIYMILSCIVALMVLPLFDKRTQT
ncbi:MAG: MMPL family transporter [Gammaproteobacteria bacterium]|nr:MMPL family transporter [Gammaproteobacteria bacterium]